jgi:hypothetical protein
MFRFAASTLPVTLRRLGLAAMACSVAALSACGGGDRAKAYQPDRIVSFGDENSAIDSYTDTATTPTLTQAGTTTGATVKGLVYTINTLGKVTTVCNDQGTTPAPCPASSSGLTFGESGSIPGATTYVQFPSQPSNFYTQLVRQTNPAYQQTTDIFYSCNSDTIWIQVIAHAFNRGYQTNCASDSRSGAVTYAAYQADVAAVVAQVAAHRGELGKGVLVTLMVGQWDIIELYNAVNVTHTTTQASAEAELKNRAATLANAVKDILSTGAKVVLALTPDLGQSPMALGGNQASLQALTKVFNDTLYITNLGNESGRNLAGVNPEPFTEPSVRSTAYYYDAAACDPAKSQHPGDPSGTPESSIDAYKAVLFCTGDTLVSGTSTSVYMWADNIHFTPSGHNLIGSAGYNRAYNQF